MRKYLSTMTTWGLSFGYAVGWGSFVMPATSFLPGAGPLGTVIGVFLGSLVMLVIAWNYHRLIERRQCSGGSFKYAQDAFGPDYGFLTAWFLTLAYLAILWANATALVLVARHTMGDLLQFGFHYRVADFDVYFGEALFSALAILASGILILFHKRLAVHVNLGCMLAFAAGVVTLFAIGLSQRNGDYQCFSPAFSPLSKDGAFVQTMGILGMMPWAFVGFEAISHSAPEFLFPPRRSFAIMLVAVISAFLAYSMLALLPVMSLPPDCADWPDYIRNFHSMSGPDALPTLGATVRIFGQTGASIFYVLMVTATFTGIIASIVALSRLLRGLAEEKVLPAWFGELNQDGSPKNSVCVIVAISLVIPFLGRTATSWPMDVSSIGAAITYCLCSAAAFKFAREKKQYFTMVTGIAGCILSIIFCLLLMVPNYLAGENLAAESYLLLAIWSMLGFGLYRYIFKHSRERFGHSMIVWIGVLVLILFSSLMWVRQTTQEVIQNTGDNITRFYEERRRSFADVNLDSTQVEREAEFMSDQMQELNEELLEYDLVQILILVLTLVLVFSLYRTQQYREKLLDIARAKAEDSNKAKSGFLSNMSHDIRTPMNAIIGYTELAKRNGVTEANLRGYLKKIEASSHHLLALVNDVLEMSRIESGKMELEPSPINLKALLSEVKDMFATQMSVKKIAFTVDISRLKNECVLCDRNRLNRVLLNLISNAYKFTPEGGRISITAIQKGDAGKNAGKYEFRVKDTGIGMSSSFATKVFDAFEREHTSTVSGIQGTGLGMAITKSIVDLMNGTISVETEQGKGTEFTIALALPYASESDVVSHQSESPALSQADFSSRRILLVDDNEINRDIATQILTEVGFEVDPAENGQVAVEKMAQGGVGFYDVILMDVQMPMMNGYEATRAIRGMHIPGLSDIPIIALSANAFESDVREALAAGMNAHVAKPIHIPELMAKLGELLANRPVRQRPPLAKERRGKSALLMNRPLQPQALIDMLKGIGCDIDETIAKTFMGNVKFYLKMLAKLPANTALERMRQALEAKDAKALFEAAHEIKGVYASLGLTPLYDPCSEIVEIARAGGTEGVDDKLTQLEELHSEVVSLVETKSEDS